MKIIVTGGAGFIGSHIVDKLISEGHRVVVIDNLSSGNKKNLNKKSIFYKIDIQNSNIDQIFKKEKPMALFHFAAHTEARPSAQDPMYDARNNIVGSLNIFENCRKFGVKKIIFASTGGEIYGNATRIPTNENYQPQPVSPYGIAKFTIEKYLDFYNKIYHISYVALRYGNVYGPRQNPNKEAGVIAIFSKKMLNNKQPLIHGSGKQTKDYIFIDDVVEATLLAFKKNISGVFNIGTCKETSVIEIFSKLNKIIGKNIKEKQVAFPLIGFKRGCLSITKAKKYLKFKPKYTLDRGLALTVNYFKSNI